MATETISITLPKSVADSLREKVRSGKYADESDVVISGLMVLDEQDIFPNPQVLDDWLRNEVVPIALRMRANPDSGYSVEEVLAHIEQDMRELDEHADVA